MIFEFGVSAMKRRELIMLLGGAAAAWPLAARGQQDRTRRIGVLIGTLENDPEASLRVGEFRQALAKLGWSEGRNVVIEFRFGAGDPNRMRAQAKELTGISPDVVVAESTPAAVALRQETVAVPIVFLQEQIRSAAASSRAWRVPVRTLPGLPILSPRSAASGLNYSRRSRRV
jgi:putative tryptophan/tyrosine transport system substrate-binding protein